MFFHQFLIFLYRAFFLIELKWKSVNEPNRGPLRWGITKKDNAGIKNGEGQWKQHPVYPYLFGHLPASQGPQPKWGGEPVYLWAYLDNQELLSFSQLSTQLHPSLLLLVLDLLILMTVMMMTMMIIMTGIMTMTLHWWSISPNSRTLWFANSLFHRHPADIWSAVFKWNESYRGDGTTNQGREVPLDFFLKIQL